MKKKIAVFLNVRMNFESVKVIDDNDDLQYWLDDGYVQLTEIVEVDFPEVSDGDMVKSQIKVIDDQIAKALIKWTAEVNRLKDLKQQLLAIGHDK